MPIPQSLISLSQPRPVPGMSDFDPSLGGVIDESAGDPSDALAALASMSGGSNSASDPGAGWSQAHPFESAAMGNGASGHLSAMDLADITGKLGEFGKENFIFQNGLRNAEMDRAHEDAVAKGAAMDVANPASLRALSQEKAQHDFNAQKEAERLAADSDFQDTEARSKNALGNELATNTAESQAREAMSPAQQALRGSALEDALAKLHEQYVTGPSRVADITSAGKEEAARLRGEDYVTARTAEADAKVKAAELAAAGKQNQGIALLTSVLKNARKIDPNNGRPVPYSAKEMQDIIAQMGGGSGAAGGANIPPAVAQALKGAAPGKHTLSDGSTWVVNPDGSVIGG
jgi:hypothetical protein